MTLYLIGIGLADEKDISVKGLEIIRKCDKAYAENYTSLLQCTLADLKKFYQKKIIPAPREISEQGAQKIVDEAKSKEVAFLVIGDPFSATTHVELFRLAKEENVPVKVIHNASIMTAIGITGLQLYKFGRTASLPFRDKVPNLKTPYEILRENHILGLHTLLLLDIESEESKFMTVNLALETLQHLEKQHKEGIIDDDTLVMGCARLGSDDFIVQCGPLATVRKKDFGRPPHCLIVPGKLHFMEEEMLGFWR